MDKWLMRSAIIVAITFMICMIIGITWLVFAPDEDIIFECAICRDREMRIERNRL